MSSRLMNNIVESFWLFQNSEPERKSVARNLFLRYCGAYYEDWTGNASELIDDEYLRGAKRVLKEQAFSHAPGSAFRLKKPAENYYRQWKCIKEALKSGDLQAHRVNELVEAHLVFGKQWIEECKCSLRDYPIGAKLNAPKTLELFYNTVSEWILQNPSYFEEIRNSIDMRDENLFLAIPYHAALKAIQSVNTKGAPELFKPFERDMIRWKAIYDQLSPWEQQDLLRQRNPFSESDDSWLTKEAGILFKEICEKIDRLRDQRELQPINPVYEVVFQNIDQDLQLVESLGDYRAFPYGDITPLEAIAFIRNLPQGKYAEFKNVFTWLPGCKAALSNNEAKRPSVNRIVSIIQIAQARSRWFCTIL